MQEYAKLGSQLLKASQSAKQQSGLLPSPAGLMSPPMGNSFSPPPVGQQPSPAPLYTPPVQTPKRRINPTRNPLSRRGIPTIGEGRR